MILMVDLIKLRISKPENGLIEITQSKHKRKTVKQKSGFQSYGTMSKALIYPELELRKENVHREEETFKDIMAKSFPRLMKDIKIIDPGGSENIKLNKYSLLRAFLNKFHPNC